MNDLLLFSSNEHILIQSIISLDFLLIQWCREWILTFQGCENKSLDEWHPRCLGEQMTSEVSIRAFLSKTLGLTSSQTLKGEKHRPNNVLCDFREWTVRLSLRAVHSQANTELYNTFYGVHERLIWSFFVPFFRFVLKPNSPFWR